MIRLSWVVLVHAALLSTESVAVELLTNELGLSPLVIAATSSTVAGGVLLLINTMKQSAQAFLIFKSWKFLIPGSILVAAGLFTLFDSISAVGASKVGLLAGPLETVVIMFLAWAFLHEKLSRAQMIGVIIALGGFLVTIGSDMGTETHQEPLRWGDVEAVLSAILLAVGIILITKLTNLHTPLVITGWLLLISGSILSSLLWTADVQNVTPPNFSVLLLFSLLPLSVALTYVMGLARIGASLTSIIASFSILLTPIFQLILLGLNVEVIMPANVPLAIAGGILGISGIYLVHRPGQRDR